MPASCLLREVFKGKYEWIECDDSIMSFALTKKVVMNPWFNFESINNSSFITTDYTCSTQLYLSYLGNI